MIYKLVVLFCVLYTVCGKHVKVKDDEQPSLSWPSKYYVEAVKRYLTAGWEENFKYWRSSKSSRLDANDGAVIKIARSKTIGRGTKYEIHPETTEEDVNKMVCYRKEGTMFNPVRPEAFLPRTSDLDRVGEEDVKGIESVLFTNDGYDKNADTKKKLWAIYDNGTWVPVRYEKQAVDSWHGFLNDHVIWDFFNFEADVNLDVFKVEYNCTLKPNNDDDDLSVGSAAESLKSLKPKEMKHLNHLFKTYKKQFNKQYTDKAEHEMRKAIFHKKWSLVEEKNRQKLGFQLALNKLSDRTDEEMKRYRGLRRNGPRKVGNIAFPYTKKKIEEAAQTLPAEYDLRLDGVVGPVLNQEDCGSCWTFGTTAAMEGALARYNGGTLVKLSNQALIDCSWGFGNSGCDGGTDTGAFSWIMENGIPTELEYGPYTVKEGFCKMENMTKTYKIRGFTDVTPFSVSALKVALVNHGPLSVSIHSSDALEMYAGGIFYDPECSSEPTKLNHEVTLVGYGEKDGDTFWIIKNSRGPFWGLDGYIHISARDNNCGVATEPTYVVI